MWDSWYFENRKLFNLRVECYGGIKFYTVIPGVESECLIAGVLRFKAGTTSEVFLAYICVDEFEMYKLGLFSFVELIW